MRRFFRAYFGKGSTPRMDDIRGVVWLSEPDSWYGEAHNNYSLLVLEQYKIYVEMADRISARRGLTNTFFLTLNSAIFTLIGAFWVHRPHAASWFLVFPVVVLIAQCMAWFWLVRSYGQLNTAKYAVVGSLEERLPASPYWRAEWKALGEGKDPSIYWPLSHLERWIPILFATAYLGGFLATLIA